MNKGAITLRDLRGQYHLGRRITLHGLETSLSDLAAFLSVDCPKRRSASWSNQ